MTGFKTLTTVALCFVGLVGGEARAESKLPAVCASLLEANPGVAYLEVEVQEVGGVLFSCSDLRGGRMELKHLTLETIEEVEALIASVD